MLFNKKIEPRCEYCQYGSPLGGDDGIICHKKGISDPDESCRSFVYDPTRRQPDPPAVYRPRQYSEEDFQL